MAGIPPLNSAPFAPASGAFSWLLSRRTGPPPGPVRFA